MRALSFPNRFPFSPGFYLIIFLSLFLLAVLPVLSGLPVFFQTAQEFAPAVESLNSFPLAFVPSQDQSAGAAAFESLSMNGSLAFTPAGLSLKLPAVGDLSGQSLQVTFLGANPDVRILPEQRLAAEVNVYASSQPEGWITGLPTYQAVRYQSLYPGIDVVYSSQEGQLKSTYILSAGAEPESLRWMYAGAEAVAVGPGGELGINLPDGTRLSEQAPVAWQEIGGQHRSVDADYRVGSDGSVSFSLGAYDPAAALIIDPTFIYESVFNFAQFDNGWDIAVDASGSAYIVGRAYNTDNDVLVAKIAADGSLQYMTILRGTKHEAGVSLALDGQGGLLIAGWTDSSDFPILNASQPVLNGFRDAFIVKLSTQDGSLLFSTFFGGSRADEGHGIALNAAGEIYLVGTTDSTDLPLVNPIQAGLNLTSCFCNDVFVTRFSPDTSSVLSSTYLGGARDDTGTAIGLDASGDIYIAGYTLSTDFPLQNALQPVSAGGQEGFAARISADGSHLVYGTYLGGADIDSINSLSVDGSGYAYLVGNTRSADFPTTLGSYQPGFAGAVLGCGLPPYEPLRNCDDAFVTRLLPDGSGFAYSTYLGGTRDDIVRDVAIDPAGRAHVIGYSQSTDFPPQGTGGSTAFVIIVAQLGADGSTLNYSLQIPSAVANAGHGITLDSLGDVYITSGQNSPADTYVARISSGGGSVPTPTSTLPPASTPTATPPPTSTPTPTPEPSPMIIHIGDLDGYSAINGNRWSASVVVTVHDESEQPVAGAVVGGSWSGGYKGTVSCVTVADGTCDLSTGYIRRRASNVTFTVTDVSLAAGTYAAGANHDPDGDSSGTYITIARP